MTEKNVVIAITSLHSEESRNFVRQAIEWINRSGGKANVTALYTIADSLVDVHSVHGDYLNMHSLLDEIKKKAIEDGEKFIEEIRSIYGKELNLVAKVRVGNPVAEIVREARELRADAVLIRADRSTRLKRMLFGSITSSISRMAPCPTVIV